MKIRNIALAGAALALVAAPAVAQANFGRALAPVEGESEAAGSSGLLIGVLAAAAVIGGIIVIADDDPASP